ncbi:hypothetical protein [Erythrobacter sp.]|uniref:hypothetical protein n=1 Tax=Erythrobacter sp. TaxID=1042 RepID=UPI001B1A4008|nr:hypothetical protein [Erythrobacter sp.]MBO6529605.1 hypothetical protein [Erythrobacter sp.]
MRYAIAGVAALFLFGPQIALAEDAKTKKADELVCKYQKLVGSKIPEKICMTPEGWEELDRQNIEANRSDRIRNRSGRS